MITSSKHIDRLAGIIRKLYDHIHTENFPNDPPYSGSASKNREFVLDWVGYYEWYGELLRALFDLPKVKNIWSEHGICEQIAKLLSDLASIKFERFVSAQFSINFGEMARRLLEKIDVDFAVQDCYVPVIGLALAQPLVLGDVTFWPLEGKIKELKTKTIDPSLFDRLHPFTDSVASCSVKAETLKAIELVTEKVESALNTLRYLSTLVWQDEPPKQIFVGGRESSRSSFALSIDSEGRTSRAKTGLGISLPFIMNSEILQIANSWGLNHLNTMLGAATRSPLEESLLDAIAWFGDASKDASPIHAFVKFYISLEIISKLREENAGVVLPNRISMLIEPYNPARRNRLKKSVKAIIEERNAIFHAGKPERLPIDYLEYVCRRIARNTIAHLRMLIDEKKIKTKNEMIAWVSEQQKRMDAIG